MTTTTPTVNGRVIALAHYAGRAVLESVLVRHGMTFQQSVTLRPIADAGAAVERDGVVAQVVDALKIEAADVQRVVEELATKQLITTEGPKVLVTDAGRELYTEVSAETGKISARIYDGISTQDLATAGRVLALVTERANAELAALAE
ncbi:MarR family winged helix-turn-helix transcriptional regulator [Streptomyces sp. V4I2]|uniref:MarR family winged helix-turn-helix transcriptional regulator n=1 Tax=Streptomyces sp. V4I2 TaxID=3042280 RepID=UPI002781A87A|nr:MarR family transcriptional regulator [Streptomyces sp. V4I2]MDQ1050462.1 DNA-binding MarR family transcriptional regulator [Streptomyces sp. V4I2]